MPDVGGQISQRLCRVIAEVKPLPEGNISIGE
jgi:hypothetical protein